MSQQQESFEPEAGEPNQGARNQQQQQQQPQSEGHGGRGSDSALEQMRVWEQDRSSLTGGKGRSGGR